MTDREIMEQAADVLQAVREAPASKDEIQRAWIVSDLLRRRLAQQEQCQYPDCKCATENPCLKGLAQPEPVQCEPQEAVTEDGWCDWVCPKPTGYLMQCCDCGLIHEVDSRVAKYEPRPSEMFEVVNDPDLQVQWRMKRRDDISPKQPRQWQWLTDDEIALICGECAASAHKTDDISYARAIEAKLKEKNT